MFFTGFVLSRKWIKWNCYVSNSFTQYFVYVYSYTLKISIKDLFLISNYEYLGGLENRFQLLLRKCTFQIKHMALSHLTICQNKNNRPSLEKLADLFVGRVHQLILF